MSNPPRRPGPESTLDQTKSQLVEAAIELLRQRGVDIGLGHIPLSDSIARAGVTRSTAYRSLADDELSPQAVLHREILRYLLTRYSKGETMTSLTAEVTTELDRHADRLASGQVADRTMAMRCVIRVGANTSYTNVIRSPERAILTSIYGALQSSPDLDWRHRAIAEGEHGLNQLFTELYAGLIELFGYQIKPPFTVNQFAAAAASLVEGIAMRDGFNEHVDAITRPTGVDGEVEEWTLFAVAFESLVVGMFEPRNADAPFADLRNY